MPVKDLIQRKVVTIEPEDSVMLAAQRMKDKMVGSLVILDGDKPAGIITDRDIAIRVVGTGKTPKTLVKEVMTKDPITIREDASFFELTKAFRDAAVRRLIVVDKNGKLIGLISIDDVLELLTTEFANLIAAIRG
ncbi:putative signal transduction protein with CBS domains [Desulfurobacterium thermolithotrophum DSM 11699]|uniref:Putative signal transduction protein with CBS domains n=1 Tax=Desulfurobacterium thermolithotrophum (strain DSM 11699 / BSA) TaxID=868864 RepID=F0S476_DESTD|nr:CBS domain-containing protein [Desulfurobacterium thermolithotrophum]ADY73648.1 putative signal transduction protein with CBS domains [Desulfurobacterium thermolithotrophum DSM 11699]